MKRYGIAYAGIALFCFIMILTKGWSCSTLWYAYDDYRDSGIIDGFAGEVWVSLPNIVAIVLVFVGTFVMTVLSKNQFKGKWFCLVGVLLLLFFIPIGTEHLSGGIAGTTIDQWLYLPQCCDILIKK